MRWPLAAVKPLKQLYTTHLPGLLNRASGPGRPDHDGSYSPRLGSAWWHLVGVMAPRLKRLACGRRPGRYVGVGNLEAAAGPGAAYDEGIWPGSLSLAGRPHKG